MTVSEKQDSPLCAEQKENFKIFLNTLTLTGFGKVEGLIDAEGRKVAQFTHADHTAILATRREDFPTWHRGGGQGKLPIIYEAPGVPPFSGYTVEETAQWVWKQLQNMLSQREQLKRLKNLFSSYGQRALKEGTAFLGEELFWGVQTYTTFCTIQKNAAWRTLMDDLKAQGLSLSWKVTVLDEQGDHSYTLTLTRQPWVEPFGKVKAAIAALHPKEDDVLPPEGKSFNLSALLGSEEASLLNVILACEGWREVRQGLEALGYWVIIKGPMGGKVLTLKPKPKRKKTPIAA